MEVNDLIVDHDTGELRVRDRRSNERIWLHQNFGCDKGYPPKCIDLFHPLDEFAPDGVTIGTSRNYCGPRRTEQSSDATPHESALHYAVGAGDLEMVVLMLKRGWCWGICTDERGMHYFQKHWGKPEHLPDTQDTSYGLFLRGQPEWLCGFSDGKKRKLLGTASDTASERVAAEYELSLSQADEAMAWIKTRERMWFAEFCRVRKCAVSVNAITFERCASSVVSEEEITALRMIAEGKINWQHENLGYYHNSGHSERDIAERARQQKDTQRFIQAEYTRYGISFDPSSPFDWNDPLRKTLSEHRACEMATALLEHGATVTVGDLWASRENVPLAKLLLERGGVNVNVCRRPGFSPPGQGIWAWPCNPSRFTLLAECLWTPPNPQFRFLDRSIAKMADFVALLLEHGATCDAAEDFEWLSVALRWWRCESFLGQTASQRVLAVFDALDRAQGRAYEEKYPVDCSKLP